MKIALVGNPNCGKTSLFNVLTGSNQKVGNWPGVTIERKSGHLLQEPALEIIDLPGIYSLSATSKEEQIARDYLLSGEVDCLINLVDGTNLERNLYLTMQLLELNVPIVMAVNMCDVMKQQHISLDAERFAYQLDIPVVYVSAAKKIGLNELVKQVKQVATTKINLPRISYVPQLESLIEEVEQSVPSLTKNDRNLILSLLENQQLAARYPEAVQQEINEICQIGRRVFANDLMTVIIDERYQKIEQILQFSLYSKNSKQRLGRIVDKLVTNQWLAFPIFIFVMWLVYYLSIQTIGTMCTDWINDVLLGEYLPNLLTHWMNDFAITAWLQDLVLNGIVAGVGSVIGFLPQIAVLFFCLNILEDCGYMARIAFVMDRIFRTFGLSGKSFIPLLISTGCGVPGVMATRTIENEDERKMTIMLSTFMPCSAKTAIIALIVGAFFPTKTYIAPLVYVISILTIIISGLLLKNSPFFHRDQNVFVMELPEYHFPHWSTVFRQTWLRCLSFVRKAASIIFISSVILWVMSNCSWTFHLVAEDQSMLASVGRSLSFLFKPLGFGNWQATVAVISAFSAKENIINTLGILYHQTINSADGVEIWQVLRNNYTVYAAFSFLVFNILCTPCFAAIGAMKRELGNARETISVVLFQCFMAYVMSFLIYQYSLFFIAQQGFHLGTALAVMMTILMMIGIFYKTKRKDEVEWVM